MKDDGFRLSKGQGIAEGVKLGRQVANGGDTRRRLSLDHVLVVE